MKGLLHKHFGKIAAGIILLYACTMWYCSTRLSVNGDELRYYAYAVNIAKGQPQKYCVDGIPYFNSQMPVMVFNTIPRAIEQVLHPSLQKNTSAAYGDIKNGRIISVLIMIALAFYVLTWATQLYGKRAGLMALLLYVLCPNLAAHGQMLGTDVYSFLVVTAVLYHGWRYHKTNRFGQLIYLAVWLGIGQISKQSLLLLYPVVACLFILRLRPMAGSVLRKTGQWVKEMLLIGLVSLLLINAGFLFYKTGKSLHQYSFVSEKFRNLQQQWSFVGDLPLPLPEPFIAGLDYVRFNQETGPGIEGRSAYGSTYFLGKKLDGHLLWYYYPLSLLYKLPLPFLILLGFTMVQYTRQRKRFRFLPDEVYLLLPSLFLLLCFCFLNSMYLGIKNVIMILPPLFIFCAGQASVLWEQSKKGKWLLIGLGVWQLLSVSRYFPHFLPYTNELIPDKKHAYRVFGDSNLYFQEGRDFVNAYLQQHPDIQLDPLQPVHGKVMVSLENYYDWWNGGKMQWLRELKLQPVGHFHSQYLLFDVP